MILPLMLSQLVQQTVGVDVEEMRVFVVAGHLDAGAVQKVDAGVVANTADAEVWYVQKVAAAEVLTVQKVAAAEVLFEHEVGSGVEV
jgi:hypothetical protein